MSDARLLLPSPSFFLLLARSHLPALGSNGPRRNSSASSWSQWASPDLICQLLIAVGLPGCHLPAVNRSGPRRTSTGEIRSAVGLAGPRPDSARRGPRRTSTAPQRPQTKPYRMPKRMPDRMSEDMPDRMSEDMPDRMIECQIDMPDRLSDGMNWMPWWGSLEATYFFVFREVLEVLVSSWLIWINPDYSNLVHRMSRLRLVPAFLSPNLGQISCSETWALRAILYFIWCSSSFQRNLELLKKNTMASMGLALFYNPPISVIFLKESEACAFPLKDCNICLKRAQ